MACPLLYRAAIIMSHS